MNQGRVLAICLVVMLSMGVASAQLPIEEIDARIERVLSEGIDAGIKRKHIVVKSVESAPVWWNSATQLNTFRLPPPPLGAEITYIDLDGDGDPDLLRTTLPDGTPVQWIDDDDDMSFDDYWGDTDSDCLMIDRNRDGLFGHYSDLMVDWIDTDGDNVADMQLVVDNIEFERRVRSGDGHYMWVIDCDKDNIFNYIDWNTYELRCWLHTGEADFYTDYHGNSTFLKVHSTPERLNDIRLNWENPFLFYDHDDDGLTEQSVRILDSRNGKIMHSDGATRFSEKVGYAALCYDLDNDNTAENPLDFDMTILYIGDGTDYMSYSHVYENMRGLPEADRYFMFPEWRQNSELIYPDREQVFDFMFEKGVWDDVWFTFDEDDDCKRWERVELYQPLDLYNTGEHAKGLDNNRQADVIGDRGEWDRDNSGGGNIYVGAFDGRIHLYGAEWGAWRIDQRGDYYQGMGGIFDIYGPDRQQGTPLVFPVIKYEDSDNNGFFDTFSYDIDGDKEFEEVVSMIELGLSDVCDIYKVSKMEYEDFTALYEGVANGLWSRGEAFVDAAHALGLDTSWYAHLKSPKSLRQRYDYGYWLSFYIYRDIADLAIRRGDVELAKQVVKSYYSNDLAALQQLVKK